MSCTKFQNGECDALSAFMAKYRENKDLALLIDLAGQHTKPLGHCPMPSLARKMAPMEFQPDVGQNRCAASIIQEKGGVINDLTPVLISFLRMIQAKTLDSLVTEAEAKKI